MAESPNGKSQVDIDVLKETLCAQQRLLQKLYNELDAEREASSTAASEALSMIIRLQGEKAAVQMEADHYKRMVEEKMYHAEESLAIFEDIMYQKEIELASLDYQVQTYRQKLISMGCVDPGDGEINIPENVLQKGDTKPGEVRYLSLSRRNSAPMILPPKCPPSKKGVVEDCTGQNYSDTDSGKKTESSAAGDINSCWEAIRKLDGRVKELAGVSYANLRSFSRSHSTSSQLPGNSYDLAKVKTQNEMDQVKHHPGKMVDTEMTNERSSSPGVLDVFEVPQNDKKSDASQLNRRNQEKTIFHDEDKLQKPEASTKDETDWLKRMLKSSHGCSNLRRLNRGFSVDCNIGGSPTRLQKLHQFNKISEIVEVESQALRQDSTDRQAELRLLNEIKEQLSSIQSDIIGLRPNKPSKKNELALATLKEEMLHFWL